MSWGVLLNHFVLDETAAPGLSFEIAIVPVFADQPGRSIIEPR